MKATVYTRCKLCAFDLASPVVRDYVPGELLPGEVEWSAPTDRPVTLLVLGRCRPDCSASKASTTIARSCCVCQRELPPLTPEEDAKSSRLCADCEAKA